ncbi:MAG: WecB/TagA/CpsF family glycosyltransferase, partial [Candidatus Curtissbacteria bacterium]|nr:WecB/TagA/CpsF family glycosyltransferase [Candidatus Curtissbacteria bacterium]
LGGREHERVTGVDLIEKLCVKSAEKAISVGFLGCFGGVAETVSKRQKEQNPGLKVVFASSGDPAIGYDLRLKKELLGVGRIDILFVAYGMGQQEFWIERNRRSLSSNKNRHSLSSNRHSLSSNRHSLSSNRLDVGVFIGVGGAFDYLSMVKMRAPRQLQNIGLEWLWRLLMEPARIWRMRVLPVFAILVIGQFFAKSLNFSPKKIS